MSPQDGPTPAGRAAWREALADPRWRMGAAGTALALPATLAAFSRFVAWVESRPGAVLDDPVLRAFAPRDWSVPTFALIYASLVAALVLLVPRPRRLLRAAQAYVLLVLARMLVMTLTPLDPPAGIVPLVDPLVEGLGPGGTLTRDLFFSGHVGTGFVLFLACPRGWTRRLLLVGTLAVGAFTLLQHAHYAVDVAAAPLFAWACWRLAHAFP